MMKVLWFTPTPSLAEGHLNNAPAGGGWIKSLEKELQGKVKLSVAFYYKRKMEPFSLGDTTYFPIYKYAKGVTARLVKKYLGLLEAREDLEAFLSIIERVKPDVIHVHGTEFPFGMVQSHCAVPVVISIQGNITVYRHKYFSGISKADARKFTSILNWLRADTKLHAFMRFTRQSARERKIFAMSSNLIGRTAWDRRITKILSPKARYFHNDEILRDLFYEKKWSNRHASGSAWKLFTTTGDSIYKGIETVIVAASLLDANGVTYEWQVAGLQANDELVTMACKSCGVTLSPNLKFLHTVGEDVLVEKLLASHIYVACSHIENSPNSLCEALILGVPCIATAAGGTVSMLTDNVDGILIQDGDPYAMAGAVLELMENYDKAIEYGNNARQKALKRHDKSVIVNDLLTIYNTVHKRQ